MMTSTHSHLVLRNLHFFLHNSTFFVGLIASVIRQLRSNMKTTQRKKPFKLKLQFRMSEARQWDECCDLPSWRTKFIHL